MKDGRKRFWDLRLRCQQEGPWWFLRKRLCNKDYDKCVVCCVYACVMRRSCELDLEETLLATCTACTKQWRTTEAKCHNHHITTTNSSTINGHHHALPSTLTPWHTYKRHHVHFNIKWTCHFLYIYQLKIIGVMAHFRCVSGITCQCILVERWIIN